MFVWRMILTAMSSLLFGWTLVVSLAYLHAWRTHPRHDWRGLLPLHVFTVSLSYDLLLLYATIEVYLRIEDDADSAFWRGMILIPAYALGFIAMYAIGKLRWKKRLVEQKNISTPI